MLFFFLSRKRYLEEEAAHRRGRPLANSFLTIPPSQRRDWRVSDFREQGWPARVVLKTVQALYRLARSSRR